MADSAKRESPSPNPRQPTDPQSCMQQVAPRLRGRQLGSIQGLRGDLQVAAGKCPLGLAASWLWDFATLQRLQNMIVRVCQLDPCRFMAL